MFINLEHTWELVSRATDINKMDGWLEVGE